MRRALAAGGLAALLLAGALALLPARWQLPGLSASHACDGVTFPLQSVPGGLSPYITLTAGGRTGAFLLDYGATSSSLSADAFAPAREGDVVREAFTLPSFASGAFSVAKYYGGRAPASGQLGIVGTDFLSLLNADFTFRDGGGGDVRLGPRSCSDALGASGLIAVSQAGFFSHDPSHLPPGRPNVPVLYLRIGNVRTWAQIDTGYDDTVLRPSIDINEALYQQLLVSGLALEPDRQLALTTCEGREQRQVLKVKDAKVTVETHTGTVIRELPAPHLIRKSRNGCGGIATMDAPAAQLGASVLTLLGRVVFDPKAEKIWVASENSKP